WRRPWRRRERAAVHHINRRRQYNLLYPRRGIMMRLTQSYHTLPADSALMTKLMTKHDGPRAARHLATGVMGPASSTPFPIISHTRALPADSALMTKLMTKHDGPRAA